MTNKTTDEKIDDLARLVAKGFSEVKVEVSEVKGDVKSFRDEVNQKFQEVDENFKEINMKLHDRDENVRRNTTRIEKLEEASVV